MKIINTYMFILHVQLRSSLSAASRSEYRAKVRFSIRWVNANSPELKILLKAVHLVSKFPKYLINNGIYDKLPWYSRVQILVTTKLINLLFVIQINFVSALKIYREPHKEHKKIYFRTKSGEKIIERMHMVYKVLSYA